MKLIFQKVYLEVISCGHDWILSNILYESFMSYLFSLYV